jgi:hypothetical protein
LEDFRDGQLIDGRLTVRNADESDITRRWNGLNPAMASSTLF